MGSACCKTVTPEQRAIDARMKANQENDQRTKKLLFLGAGGSGKSTLFKQMRIIHSKGGEDTLRPETWVNFVYANLIQGIQGIVEGAGELKQSAKENGQNEDLYEFKPEVQEHVHKVMANNLEEKVGPELAESMVAIWEDPCAKEVWKARGVLQIQDSFKYFMGKINEIQKDDYLPSVEDILNVRTRTTGIVQETFLIKEHPFLFVDVGGQRNERRKWFHAFDNVTAVIFVASLSAFDCTLFEDDLTNRMHEALKVFGDVLGLFEETDIILFLNKSDLFMQKLAEGSSISVAFPEYKGTNDVKESYDYIRNQFKAKATNGRNIFVHMTNATDTTMVKKIFADVQSTIVTNSLRRAGLVTI